MEIRNKTKRKFRSKKKREQKKGQLINVEDEKYQMTIHIVISIPI